MSTNQPLLPDEDNPLDVDLTPRAFKRCKLPNPIHIAPNGEEILEWIPRWDAGESPIPLPDEK